ncbi:hypothetical protein AB9P91_002227 [Salmonella enterica]|uniref:hypothetical protein n=1 Tax=Salmonella enterica TaxID=28901 RepID=UPI0003BCEB15|nr:hypothetical protein [Salmonella enterica subsp. enterica serovar Newport]EIN0890673.1 hypothetical protein [Salmonella enterica]EKK6329719.1 hypothetical protein [Salmonella enterica]ELH6529677.1 hypothetical protein [Salmonella enterica]ESG72589.1 hypothetical protein SEEM1594_07610 [Salmonella enterica subsp. enterica serovar Muenchen str. baa1594]
MHKFIWQKIFIAESASAGGLCRFRDLRSLRRQIATHTAYTISGAPIVILDVGGRSEMPERAQRDTARFMMVVSESGNPRGVWLSRVSMNDFY